MCREILQPKTPFDHCSQCRTGCFVLPTVCRATMQLASNLLSVELCRYSAITHYDCISLYCVTTVTSKVCVPGGLHNGYITFPHRFSYSGGFKDIMGKCSVCVMASILNFGVPLYQARDNLHLSYSRTQIHHVFSLYRSNSWNIVLEFSLKVA